MTQNISEVALLTDLCGSPEFSFEETSGLFQFTQLANNTLNITIIESETEPEYGTFEVNVKAKYSIYTES